MNPNDVKIGMMVRVTEEGKEWYRSLHTHHQSVERLGPGWRGRVVEIRKLEHDYAGDLNGQYYVMTKDDIGGVFVKFIEPDKVDLDDLLNQLEKDLIDKDDDKNCEAGYYPYNSDMR